MCIGGKTYEISTEFKHPGGVSLFNTYDGLDATNNFLSHHLTKVCPSNIQGIRVLRDDGDSESHEDDVLYSQLKTKVHAVIKRVRRRWYMPYVEPCTNICLFGSWIVLYLMWLVHMTERYSVLLGVWTVPTVINLFHSQTHRPDEPWAWTRYFYDVLGPSTDVWSYQHNVLHHQYVNTPKDPDIYNGLPFLRFHASQPWQWYHRYQTLYILPMYTLSSIGFILHNAFTILAPSVLSSVSSIGMIASSIPSGRLSKWKYIVTRIPGICVFLVLPVVVANHPFQRVLLAWVINLMSSGIILGVLLNASHISAIVPETTGHLSFLRNQAQYSVNMSGDSWIARLLTGGLNLQVEHHLFPSLSVQETAEIRETVRSFLRHVDIPYNDIPIHHAVWFHILHMYHMSFGK
jgi:linoleoyl-CoA desaturase